MTTFQARAIAADFKERSDAMGIRTGEGLRLGNAATIIVDLCNQLDALSPPVEAAPEPVVDGQA